MPEKRFKHARRVLDPNAASALTKFHAHKFDTVFMKSVS